MFTDEHIWCQLFSEPGAGSDLAGLAARAERDGDEWVVNGQKVWTSLAHRAHWGMLVARTDPDAPKHRGITYFALDLHSPGVEVRPLRQITGDAEFNEVYLTDVRVPDSDRIGDENAGWSVLLTTLLNERVALGGGVPTRGSGAIQHALDVWARLVVKPPELRHRLVRLWVRAEVRRLANTRGAALAASGAGTPLYGALGKIAGAELNQEIYGLCMDLLGPAGMLYDSYEMHQPDQFMVTSDDPAVAFLRSQGQSMEGGTTDVMRNLVGERVLGLPGEPRVDKEVPWRSVPRS
jgi:alkylation response protein AidB-like acyl-CoA dehydrogenase